MFELPTLPVFEQLVERLRQTEFLQALSEEELHTLAKRTHVRAYDANETIIRQGEASDSCFLLDEGELAVYVSKGREDREVGRLRPPATVGELALFTSEARSATVKAATPVRLFVIDRESFKDSMVGNPRLTVAADTIRRFFGFSRAESKLLSRDLVQGIWRDGTGVRPTTERREITILFADIRSFTPLSESLPPEELAALLNEYLSEMVKVVFRHGGTIDKYIGDALMVLFGAPLAQQDHAVAACRTALEMLASLDRLNVAWGPAGRPQLGIGIGIGINTGEVVVGFIGDWEHRMEYTVVGDAVNLASRLESLNKDKGTQILLSEFTRARAGDQIRTVPLGEVRVKGRERCVSIYALEGLARADMPRHDSTTHDTDDQAKTQMTTP